MSDKSTYIIYLDPSVADDQWAFLDRFFHPGIRTHDKKCALLGYSLDISHPVFLSVTVRDRQVILREKPEQEKNF